MKTVQIAVSDTLRAALKKAKGESTYGDFISQMLDRDAAAEFSAEVMEEPSKAWEAPLGMVTEEEAINAVVKALGDPELVALCARVGERYARRTAREFLGLGDPKTAPGGFSLPLSEEDLKAEARIRREAAGFDVVFVHSDEGRVKAYSDEEEARFDAMADEEREAELDAREEGDDGLSFELEHQRRSGS